MGRGYSKHLEENKYDRMRPKSKLKNIKCEKQYLYMVDHQHYNMKAPNQ
jgi:hypothetical protein